jgi:hypothetical protein
MKLVVFCALKASTDVPEGSGRGDFRCCTISNLSCISVLYTHPRVINGDLAARENGY